MGLILVLGWLACSGACEGLKSVAQSYKKIIARRLSLSIYQKTARTRFLG